MIYPYRCPKCGNNEDIHKPVDMCSNIEHCKKCGCVLERVYTASALRTSDTFGFKNHFYDHDTKTYIDSRKKWKEAGFMDPLDGPLNENTKAGIKRKVEKIKKYDTKKKFSVDMGKNA